MEILEKNTSIPTFRIIVFFTIALTIALAVMLFLTNAKESPKMLGIISGLITGIIVGLFQLYLSWYEHKKIKKFEEMAIIDVLINRDGRTFYENLIKNCNTKISVMGVTASRFIHDFADLDANAGQNAKVLLVAMNNHVKVKILLPHPNHLPAKEKQAAETLKTELDALKLTYPNNFEYKYFAHAPAHSIFIVDDTCIIGPVFPDVSSKHTPAIHLENKSPFAIKYIEYYNNEWSSAT